MLTGDVDWLPHRLEVRGPDRDLQKFMLAAQGPGFIDWRMPASDEREMWALTLRRGGARSMALADRLAARYAEWVWWSITEARSAVERGELLAPLDLNALRPIPRKVLMAGWADGGRQWMWQHWGTCLPLRKVEFRFEHRAAAVGAGIEVAAVYTFLSADWSPWRAWRAWRRKYPALTFTLRPLYGQSEPAERLSKVA